MNGPKVVASSTPEDCCEASQKGHHLTKCSIPHLRSELGVTCWGHQSRTGVCALEGARAGHCRILVGLRASAAMPIRALGGRRSDSVHPRILRHDTGPKTAADSYARIAAAVERSPSEVLFLSDVGAELDAARRAGLRTALCVRSPVAVPPGSGHPVIRTFDQVVLGNAVV